MHHQNIDEVLAALDEIVEESLRENDFLAIFAWVYRRTTAQIKSEIELENFEDNERLRKFDVIFAGIYIDAYHRFKQGESVSRSWQTVFDARFDKLALIQHLLLGMNAHINLDLAIAAAKVMQGKPMAGLENDFNKVNDILAGLLNEMQSRLSRSSILMFLLDWLGKRSDEKIINFSMARARAFSWKLACEIGMLQGPDKEARILQADRSVYSIGEYIKKPESKVLRFVLKLIHRFEEKKIGRIIANLRA